MIIFFTRVNRDNGFRKHRKGYDMALAGLDDLLTVEEVAEYLRVPKTWVYERTRTRAIPVRKIGRHVRIPRDELLAWVEREGTLQAA